jgi:uncharacterized protein (DUF1810 family)
MTDSLDRFVRAQTQSWSSALAELQAGRKETHWMWFIFPQLRELGRSETARFYGIADRREASAYLTHEVLGPRLIACTQAVLKHTDKSTRQILGSPDDLKFVSCMTLFSQVAPAGLSVFQEALAAFNDGVPDTITLELLGHGNSQAGTR